MNVIFVAVANSGEVCLNLNQQQCRLTLTCIKAPLFFMAAAYVYLLTSMCTIHDTNHTPLRSFSGTMVTVAATRSFLRFFRPRDAAAAARAPLAERRIVWQDAGAPQPRSSAEQNTGLARHEVMVCVCCLRPDSGGVLARDVIPDYDDDDTANSGSQQSQLYGNGHGWAPPGIIQGCSRGLDDIEEVEEIGLDERKDGYKYAC